MLRNSNNISLQASIPQKDGSKQTVIGEAQAFYELPGECRQLLVVCRLLENTKCELGAWNGSWSSSQVVLDAQNIMDKVGIWHMKTAKAKIWIL